MTREQAKNLLQNNKPKENNAYSLMLNEALDMAIEALEQESQTKNEEIYCDRNLCFNYECSTCPVNNLENEVL